MRILFTNHFGAISGAEKDILSLFEVLDFDLYQPILACPNENDGLAYAACKLQVPHFTLPETRLVRSFNIFKWIKYLFILGVWTRTLSKIVKEERINIIYANSFSSAIFSSLAAFITSTPIIWRMHDILKDRNINHLMVRLLSKYVDRVVCVSHAVESNMISLGVPPGKLKIIRNSMYTHMRVSKLTQDEAKLRLGYQSSTNLIVMVGQIAEWKGQHIFLEAAAQILTDFEGDCNLKFLIVGNVLVPHEEPYRDRLAAYIKQLGIDKHVIMLGFRDDVLDIMRACDILVHASIWHDPFPTVILEGLASGNCIVASNLGGVPEIIEDGASGILYDPGDVSMLARILEDLLQAPAQRRELGGGALKRNGVFNPTVNLGMMTSLYDSLSK